MPRVKGYHQKRRAAIEMCSGKNHASGSRASAARSAFLKNAGKLARRAGAGCAAASKRRDKYPRAPAQAATSCAAIHFLNCTCVGNALALCRKEDFQQEWRRELCC